MFSRKCQGTHDVGEWICIIWLVSGTSKKKKEEEEEEEEEEEKKDGDITLYCTAV